MPLLLAFRQHKTEAGYIARLIAGYGQMEFMTGWTIGNALAAKRKPTPKQRQLLEHRTHYERVGVQLLFKIQGAERRLRRVKALAGPEYAKVGLNSEFRNTLSDLNECRRVRNLLAHSIYTPGSVGLMLSTIDATAAQAGLPEYELLDVPRQSLQELERFFWATLKRIAAINEIFAVRAALSPPPEPAMPKAPPTLKGRKELFPARLGQLGRSRRIIRLPHRSAP